MATAETEAGTAAAALAAAAATNETGNDYNGSVGGGDADDVYDPNSNVVRAEKLALRQEAQSQRYNLTSSDRHLLKAFFGYVAVTPTAATATKKDGGPIQPAKRTRDDANSYVQNALWPANIPDEQKRAEEDVFVLESFLQPAVASIITHSVTSLTKMFRDGANMNYRQQAQLIRMWQRHDDRIFTRDLAVRSSGFARVFLSGSVSEKKKRFGVWVYFLFTLTTTILLKKK